MTRGTFYLILAKNYLYSTEFNGDMYPKGYGDTAFKMLSKVNSESDFKPMVEKFNSESHKYNEELVFEGKITEIDEFLDMNKGYYDFWFSDRIFIKNLSGNDITFNVVDVYDENEELKEKNVKYVLKNGNTVRFNFGCITKESERILNNSNKEDVVKNQYDATDYIKDILKKSNIDNQEEQYTLKFNVDVGIVLRNTFKTQIQQLANNFNVKINLEEVNKGLLSSQFYIELEGNKSVLKEIQSIIEQL